MKNLMAHIDDKIFGGDIDEMHEFGWNFSTRIFVMQQIDQYRESLKFQDGWLDNVDQDLVKLDDTWLKLAQMMYGQVTEKRDQNKRL